MRRIEILGLLFLFSYGGISGATAQDFAGRFGLGVSAGPQKLLGGDQDRAMIGGWGGLNLFYGITDRLLLDVRSDLGWTRYADPKNPLKRTAIPPGKFFRTWLGTVNVNICYYFLSYGKLRSYLNVGVGGVAWQLRYARWTDDLFSPSGTNIWGTQYNASGNGGLGLYWGLSEHLGLDLLVRYHYWYRQHLDTIGDGFDPVSIGDDPYASLKKTGTGDVNNGVLELKIGLKWLLGGPRDSDQDGVIDRLDQCPQQAEDFDGFQDQDGCPDLDNDQDGIADDKDQCPNIAEDKDGYQDEDGCPDPDNDGDGISDSKDHCPNEPEDFDGFQDEDGCPDLDNDNDGIPDNEDQCPDKAETINGYQDEDGCPDEVPQEEPPVLKKGISLIFPEITFATGSARLSAAAKLKLDEVYEMLWRHEEVVVEIRGYTDNLGSAAGNLKISQKRALAVKTYLVNKGIHPNRIIAVGFGEENPIADNSTPGGRAKNRRIEFVRIR